MVGKAARIRPFLEPPIRNRSEKEVSIKGPVHDVGVECAGDNLIFKRVD